MRRGFSLWVMLLIALSAGAQIKIGMKLSPQLTWASPNNKNTTSNGIRLNAAYGIMVDYYFTDNYAFGTEFCVNSYGANLNLKKDKYDHINYQGVHPANDDVKFDYRLQYFQIPLLLKMRTNESNGIRYYAEFGFGLGFRFKAKADATFDGQTVSNVDLINTDPNDKYTILYKNNLSMGTYVNDVSYFRGSLIFGAGIHYALKGSSSLVIGLRYDNGLTSFTSDDMLSTSLSYIALNFGLVF